MKNYISSIFFILIFLLNGCTVININTINKPSIISQKLSIEEEINEFKGYGFDKEYINEIRWDSEYKLKNRLLRRERIIDSLHIPLDKLMIVDYFSHGSGGQFEVNYFFYDSTYISCSYQINRTPQENISSGKINEIYNKPNYEILVEVYKRFYLDYPNIPKKLDRKSDFGTLYRYEITLPTKDQVNFYKISNYENFVVYQLRGKKLLPL